MGSTQDIIALGSIQSKFESFGFEAITIDGHDEIAINKAVSDLWRSNKQKPKALIARTVKGKGVDFMEHDNSWHYTRLNQKSYQRAILSIDSGNL
jgi:transketolase